MQFPVRFYEGKLTRQLYASSRQVSPNTRLYTYIKGIDSGEIIAIGSTGYFRNPRGGDFLDKKQMSLHLLFRPLIELGRRFHFCKLKFY